MDTAALQERKELAITRISEIKEDSSMWNGQLAKIYTQSEKLKAYFDVVADFILYVYDVEALISEPEAVQLSSSELQDMNHCLYEDILPEHYAESFANPSYAVENLGEEYGKILSMLYAEVRSLIPYAYEHQTLCFVSLLELFLEVYGMFYASGEEAVTQPVREKEIREAIYYYMYDYADILVAKRIRETITNENRFAYDIIMNRDLKDCAYLYAYGEYIGKNEIETSKYMAGLSDEKLDALAKTYVQGFIKGFETMRIDIRPKKTVNIRYAIGQERMVRAAIKQFEQAGLASILFRYPTSRINRKQTLRPGYAGTPANKQYDYDHAGDDAVFFDRAFMERKLEVIETTYEQEKEAARVYAGPAVIEVFGEEPFTPQAKESVWKLNEKQQKLSVTFASKSAELTNRYIPHDQYSFTIIAYPIPEIGDKFPEIFDAVVAVNTLDNEKYKNIQQCMIDCLDDAQYVQVIGANGNETDMKVMLHTIDKKTQTNFENCLADVNIPLGEVFTSPALNGTNGTLHVSQVYLNELKYTDLKLTFTDGKISGYTCRNFDTEEENKAFIKENLLFHHDTLPIGEFAIGTNTTAYVMAGKYDIVYKLPILIVEKMGPHFAVGDTCYSYSEDSRLYNPDGREIVAKENECSALRNSEDKNEREKAYFNCHTDITIPYEEIGGIYAVKADGTKTALMEHGRFVLPGTEALNEPLDARS